MLLSWPGKINVESFVVHSMLVYNHSVPDSTAKDELVAVIHSILKESSEIEKLSRKVAEACPEKGLKKV